MNITHINSPFTDDANGMGFDDALDFDAGEIGGAEDYLDIGGQHVTLSCTGSSYASDEDRTEQMVDAWLRATERKLRQR